MPNMCDDHYADDLKEFERRGDITRRHFGKLTLGTGLAALLPAVADALEVSESEVEIKTADGVCDAYFVHPAKGRHAAVLMWPDIMGLRPAFRAMGKRLAQSGYAVLVPNPFYRAQRAPIVTDGKGMQDEATRNRLFGLMGSLNADTALTDARAFIGFLDAQHAVNRHRKMGTCGYCMGGPLTMRTAANFPDRIGAGASFHGAALVTDKPDSPHLLVPKMKARYLIAIAANDDERQPEAKTVLRGAFDQAHLQAEIEVYAGAMHGWCPPDSPVYDAAMAEKAWGRMLALFGRALV
jgi:carboxymethylenebutenolidase